MKEVTVVVPHAYAIKWTQILISSLLSFDNNKFDILMLNNSPNNLSINGIKDTILGKKIKIIEPPRQMQWHAGCLDYAIDLVNTPYFFSTENDCRALKNNWLDIFINSMKDDWTAMAGWFWSVGDDRQYINSSATIYNTNILKRIKNEVLRNDNFKICYGPNLSLRKDFERIDFWKLGYWGPFSETRGYQEIFSHRIDKWWQEPGAWLYYRLQCEYECVRLPGIWKEEKGVAAGTYYGTSKENSYYVHYWGGTVSHNWEKHPVKTPWELKALPWWIEREDQLWREVVDKSIRQQTLDMNLCKTGQEEIDFIMNHPNVKGNK